MSTTVKVKKSAAIVYPLTVPAPDLNPGEKFAGTIITPDGKYRHHLILLPKEAKQNTWQAQMEWAASLGGELPDRFESSLLFATLRDEFKPDWYWTCEQHAAHAGYAWVQDFSDGGQHDVRKGNTCRARAVRRLIIQ